MAIGALAPSTAGAVTVIDNFAVDANGSVTLSRSSPGTATDGPDTNLMGVLGGSRRTTINYFSGGSGGTITVDLNNAVNLDDDLEFSSGAGATGNLQLFYDGGALGTVDIDADGTTAFLVAFEAAEAAGAIMTVTNGADSCSLFALVGPGTVAFPYTAPG